MTTTTSRPHAGLDLAVFDMAGTTIEEGSVVYDALRESVAEAGAHPSGAEVDAVKGMDKVTAIRTLLTDAGADTSEESVQRTFGRFTALLDEGYRARPPQAMPGVEEVFARLRAEGVKIALTTGFTRAVVDGVLTAVGWGAGVVDAVVTTDDVPAGRPAPYLIHEAMRRTGAEDVRRVISAGDTIADIRSAKNAGAVSVAVLSGDTDRATLEAEQPTYLLDSVADLFTVRELR